MRYLLSPSLLLQEETFPYLFATSFEKQASRPMLLSQEDDSVFSYSDIAEIADRTIHRLKAMGLKKGDKIIIYSRLNIETFPLLWAAANLGIIFVPVDSYWRRSTLEQIFATLEPQMIFCDRPRFAELPAQRKVPVVVFDDSSLEEPENTEKAIPKDLFFSQWLDDKVSQAFEPGEEERKMPSIAPTDVLVILHTSGTTTTPKGIMLSHEALYKSSKLITEVFRLNSEDRMISTAELHSVSGIRFLLFCGLITGYLFLLPRPGNSVLGIVEFIIEHRCTYFMTGPNFLKQILQFTDRFTPTSLQSLRGIGSTGSTLDLEIVRSFYEHFHIRVFNYYGLTETSGLCIGVGWENFDTAQGSIGTPRRCDVEIVDENDHRVNPNEIGELRIRSQQLMLGYYGQPELTAQVMRNGWFHTGDFALMRPDGCIVLKGRKKNIIKNFYGDIVQLEEVEIILSRHPKVKECSICSYTNSEGQDSMAAFVVPHIQPGDEAVVSQELKNFIAHELGIGKIPQLFFFKEALPRTASGKVIQSELKKDIL